MKINITPVQNMVRAIIKGLMIVVIIFCVFFSCTSILPVVNVSLEYTGREVLERVISNDPDLTTY